MIERLNNLLIAFLSIFFGKKALMECTGTPREEPHMNRRERRRKAWEESHPYSTQLKGIPWYKYNQNLFNGIFSECHKVFKRNHKADHYKILQFEGYLCRHNYRAYKLDWHGWVECDFDYDLDDLIARLKDDAKPGSVIKLPFDGQYVELHNPN